MSFRPQETNRPPLDGNSWGILVGGFPKICQKNHVWLKPDKNESTSVEQPHTFMTPFVTTNYRQTCLRY